MSKQSMESILLISLRCFLMAKRHWEVSDFGHPGGERIEQS